MLRSLGVKGEMEPSLDCMGSPRKEGAGKREREEEWKGKEGGGESNKLME